MPTLRALALIAIAAPTSALAQWTFVPSGTAAELRGLSIPTPRYVWASGSRGTIVRSLDSGRTWVSDTIPGATSLDFRSIHAFDSASAIVASAGEAEKGLAAIYATRTGGKVWERVYTTDTRGVFFDAIAFWDRDNGIALSDPVDSAFFLLQTRDGGRTWSRIAPGTLPRVLPGEAAFAASGSSLVLVPPATIHIGTGGGGRARVMTSHDRGRSWSVTETPVHAAGGAAGIFALSFGDAKNGMAVGGDYTQPRLAATSVSTTTDGGRSWRASPQPPSAYLSGVSVQASWEGVSAVAVGLAGTFISLDHGSSWKQTDSTALNSIRTNGPVTVVVGPRGRIGQSVFGVLTLRMSKP